VERKLYRCVWWCILVIPALGRLKQEDLKLNTSLVYIARPCIKQPKGGEEKKKRRKEINQIKSLFQSRHRRSEFKILTVRKILCWILSYSLANGQRTYKTVLESMPFFHTNCPHGNTRIAAIHLRPQL
jgi:hypothetical protein